MTPRAKLEALQPLLDKLTAAEAGSRELDAEICAALRYCGDAMFTPMSDAEWRWDRRGFVSVYPPEGKRKGEPGWRESYALLLGDFVAPKITADAQAAIDLVERCAPEYAEHWYISKPGRRWKSEDGFSKGELAGNFGIQLHHMLSSGFGGEPLVIDAFGATLPLAIVTALVRALLAREGRT